MATIMVDFDLTSFDLSQEDIDALGGDPSQITTVPVWDPYYPEGWLAVSIGPNGARVVCPKPCGSINLPPPQ